MNTKQLSALDEDIQRNEVEKVMTGLKDGKSTGLDTLPTVELDISYLATELY